MATSTQPTITEPELLATFLLAPSPLPTIIPYSSFLTLVPQTYRNNPNYASSLKRLYRDLQFQRSITIDQVRINIERECGSRAASLRARLLRRIAIEEGDELAEREGVRSVLERRKRKRHSALLAEQDHNLDGIEEEDLAPDVDEFTDPRELVAQRTFHEHESMFHPAAHVLPFEVGSKRRKGNPNAAASPYHTEKSLLRGMEGASHGLDQEIAELEGECAKLETQIREAVEGLSDLKYGKSRACREQEVNAGSEDDSTYAEVLSALGNFQDLLRSKTQTSLAVP